MKGEYKFVIAVVILCSVVCGTAYYIDNRKNTGPTANPMEDVGSQQYYEKEMQQEIDSLNWAINTLNVILKTQTSYYEDCDSINNLLYEKINWWHSQVLHYREERDFYKADAIQLDSLVTVWKKAAIISKNLSK